MFGGCFEVTLSAEERILRPQIFGSGPVCYGGSEGAAHGAAGFDGDWVEGAGFFVDVYDCHRGGEGGGGPGCHAEVAEGVLACCGDGLVEEQLADWAEVVFVDVFFDGRV